MGSSGIGPVTNAFAILHNATNYEPNTDGDWGGPVKMRNVVELLPTENRFSEWWDQVALVSGTLSIWTPMIFARLEILSWHVVLKPRSHGPFTSWLSQNGDCVDDGSSSIESKNERSMLDHILLRFGKHFHVHFLPSVFITS